MKKLDYRHKTILFFVTLLLTFSLAATAYAHGVVITYTLKANGQVELQAEFDTGERMANAQVTIYSPEDPLNPWLTGTADAEGRYVFVIDPEMPGIWDIQYRKAGHGDIVHLQLEAGMIDPALLEQAPGELMPAAPAAEPTAATAAPKTESAAAVGVKEKAETAENGVSAAAEPTAGPETEAKVEESSAAEPATEAKAASTEALEPEAAPVAAAETAVEPEPVAETGVAPKLETAAETETVAQEAPKPASQGEETREVTVVTSGGNTATSGGFTSFQIILMSASVIWGFVGTALYFSGKKRQGHHHAHGHHH